LLGTGAEISPQDLPAHVVSQTLLSSSQPMAISNDPVSNKPQTLKEALEGPERMIILQCLQQNNWSRNETADQLGINRTTLYKKMKKLGLDTQQYAEQFQN